MASYRGHNASILSYFRHIKKVPAIITSLSAIITRIAYSLGSYSHLTSLHINITIYPVPQPSASQRDEQEANATFSSSQTSGETPAVSSSRAGSSFNEFDPFRTHQRLLHLLHSAYGETIRILCTQHLLYESKRKNNRINTATTQNPRILLTGAFCCKQ